MTLRHTLLGALMLLFGAAHAQEEERHPDHEALRGLLKTATEALTTRRFDAIAPLLHRDFTIITVDNRKLTSLEEFKAYWNALFEGEDAVLERIEVGAEADELTRFLDGDSGIAHGTSTDTYHFRNGDVRTMQSRWSAVVQQEDGVWKLVAVHFSANLLDNPVLDATRAGSLRLAGSALVGGLVLGVIVTWLVRRRRAGA